MLTTLAISGYRSLVDLVMPLGPLTVITGANGSGKSNLYRALRLLAAAGRGTVVGAIAREGGLGSVLWAGPENPKEGVPAQGTRRTRPIAVRLGFAGDGLGYLMDLGLPQAGPDSPFTRDPEIKREQVFTGPVARPATLVVDRDRSGVRVREDHWRSLGQSLGPGQSVLLDLADGGAQPELVALRHGMDRWRFYDHFRTDEGAPARLPRIGTRTPWLSDDGADLAAVWATTRDAGAGPAADAVIDRAFPGSRVEIDDVDGVFVLRLRQPGLLRALSAAELSDGTLRFLLLTAALLPAVPPPLIVVNEPEASLHESLLDPLGELLRAAAAKTQVIVVTHAPRLRRALEDAGGEIVELFSRGAGTQIRDQLPLERPSWQWPSR
ncbi:putative ATPase [Microbacterium resistens]|uniref:ATPase n=1 Tax=Microbacterium resistens TaxID=156977 RepID=A0ABU1S846_9MICO|nr:AAA family ATPase [Microbacterium resistens]MDR6865428.1 putative ATPase [Microbacterium resistens]